MTMMLALFGATVLSGCPTGDVVVYDKWEVAVNLPAGEQFDRPSPFVYNTTYLNPVAKISLPMPSTAATATVVEVPGFYYQHVPATPGVAGPAVKAVVLFRFAPSYVGLHTVALTVNGVAATPIAQCIFRAVTAAPTLPAGADGATTAARRHRNSAAGFVRVAANGQHFVGSVPEMKPRTWFGVGENLGWINGAKDTTVEKGWGPYLTNVSAAGGNYARVWLTDSWSDIFIETRLGNYSIENAANVDALLTLAEKSGIKLLMTIESFNLFSSNRQSPGVWPECVYNAANGGPVQSPKEFFTNPDAKALFKQRLRYLVSRFGHSTSVFAWEFFNEVDITDGFNPPEQAAWNKEMATYLRSIDVYKHPISTSFCCHDVPEVWTLPEMDFTMTHAYSTHNSTDMADNSQYWTVRMSAAYSKPSYVAETGEGFAVNNRFPADLMGLGLHNVLWASMVSLSAHATAVWWWDSWVNCNPGKCLYHHFTGPSKFSKLLEFADYKWTAINGTAPPAAQCTDVPPPPGNGQPAYTCAQQHLWGKCNVTANPWMQGWCCKTCTNCSASCESPNNHNAGGHTALGLGHGARLFGMAGRPLSGPNTVASVSNVGRAAGDNTMMVAWIQNANNTYVLQNASLPVDQRRQVCPIAGVVFDLGSLAAPLADGAYTVSFYDTASGTALESAAATCPGATCMAAVPTFVGDIAVLVEPAA